MRLTEICSEQITQLPHEEAMNSVEWPTDSDLGLVSHLAVNVRSLSGDSRWAYQLVDERDSSVFETGLDYRSPHEAKGAGLTRLAELTPPLPAAKVGARAPSAPGEDGGREHRDRQGS
jgi:hypothetical protein